jgi:hypothetical protein
MWLNGLGLRVPLQWSETSRTLPRIRLCFIGQKTDRKSMKGGIFTDLGLTGTNRLRPGLDQALAAVRADDTLVGFRNSITSPARCQTLGASPTN